MEEFHHNPEDLDLKEQLINIQKTLFMYILMDQPLRGQKMMVMDPAYSIQIKREEMFYFYACVADRSNYEAEAIQDNTDLIAKYIKAFQR